MVDGRHLLDALECVGSKHILVVGDLMVDQFVWGEVSRISPEAPVPVVEVQDETLLLGGAANVANNLRNLGCGVTLCGTLGRDEMGQTFQDLALSQGIDCQAVTLDDRPTILKTRIIARGQQVVRVDREGNKELGGQEWRDLEAAAEKVARSVDGIIVSDYAKGVVSAQLMDLLTSVSRSRSIPLFLDPKPSNLGLYKGVTVVTPNEKEAEAMAGMSLSGGASLEEIADRIKTATRAKGVLITRGKHGMALWGEDGEMFTIPTMAREVFDVTGAGDTVIATMALGVVAGLDFPQAAYLANLAAGIAVGKVGTATVNLDELARKIPSGDEKPAT